MSVDLRPWAVRDVILCCVVFRGARRAGVGRSCFAVELHNRTFGNYRDTLGAYWRSTASREMYLLLSAFSIVLLPAVTVEIVGSI
jgi:hypothetical protein